MEEELQKRNTDCVYFLASPLTCKKGIDCEYRHSEIARLNPRDCWYWLAGKCLNPTCGFRHPPLDKNAEEVPPESGPSAYQSSLPINKTNVPCYFYFNGFCNKGDRCFFLHGSDGKAPAGKSVKTTTVLTNVLPSGHKKSIGSEVASPVTEVHFNPSVMAPKAAMNLKLQPRENALQPAPISVLQESPSPQVAASQCEEAAVLKPDFSTPAEDFVQSGSQMSADESSQEQLDDCFEPEERWESSPGFDVLVDGSLEDLGHLDDNEHPMALEREHNHLLGYGFEESIEYDPLYPDAEHLYELEMHDSSDFVDNVQVFDDVGEVPCHPHNRMYDTLLSQKRDLLPVNLTINKWRGTDLRDHLRNRRVIDGCPFIRSSKRHGSSCLLVQNHERPRRHGTHQPLRRRLKSVVGKNVAELFGDNGTLSNGINLHGWPRNSHSHISRPHHKGKRMSTKRLFASEARRKTVPRERRSTQSSTTFTGPKTLSQLKEEKKKAEEIGEYTGKAGHASSISKADFEGPKPLSEILKGKRIMEPANECDSGGGN
uniref:C3H1-type domain-containing protein n=1 Tax=Rhizophora mucronata TaxID=61149 RepID=A0A2P2IVP5_RHIMU